MPASPAQGLAWTVTSQQETMDRDASGNIVSGYRVNFTTPSGIAGSIFVPKASYTAAKVVELLRRHVAELEAVSSSTGG